MVNSDKQQSTNDEVNCGDSIDDASSSSVSAGGASSSLSERLTEILTEDGDGDLLLQQSDREDNVLQWLQALDMQVMGACRADERLKPLLKLNLSNGAAEDCLLAHLSQHFEPAEIAVLARCLCIPLVSIRVGKINKRGTRLCPTDKRGVINLTLLPTSALRISFIGDDGCTERLATLNSDSEFSIVEIEELSADKSGRSFLIKIREGEISYFWCSEKSKLLGDELLRKMKELLKRKPSLAELTGISESRLDCFAIHLRAYHTGSSVPNAQAGPMLSPSSSLDTSLDALGLNAQTSITSPKSSRPRYHGSQGLKSSSFNQGSLSPRSSSFKEGTPRNLSSLRCVAREKLRRRGDNYLSCVDNLTFTSSSGPDLSISNCSKKDKLPEVTGSCLFPPLSPLESLERPAYPSPSCPPTQVSSFGSPLFSPYYCWCPPFTATSPYSRSVSELPVSSIESFSLPSLSSLLSPAKSSSLLSSAPSSSAADFASLDFPPLIPAPLVRSQLAMPTSQQIPTFTPLMCDSIVHIPFIDVCSSGQGYLVSAGPAISTTISPLHPNLVNPLVPEAESAVDKGARETLRLLISTSSNQPNSMMDVLPSVIINGDGKQNIFAAGSRGLYTGTKDVDAIANSIAAMRLVQLSEGYPGVGITKSSMGRNDLVDLSEDSAGSDRSSLSDGPSNVRDERTD